MSANNGTGATGADADDAIDQSSINASKCDEAPNETSGNNSPTGRSGIESADDGSGRGSNCDEDGQDARASTVDSDQREVYEQVPSEPNGSNSEGARSNASRSKGTTDAEESARESVKSTSSKEVAKFNNEDQDEQKSVAPESSERADQVNETGTEFE